ncbi:hypothetical protein MANY_42250 [Mycolicibacterium anyangense]|uniref:Uncharacterized protein n=1 Tax=Mycolicibacterium anyangense TaxID=1431246 RepID=A0A6N4WEE1_9MYCO|nr:hypothetical protein MANY_42250 [Mycolicibacterium anyangense]
MLTTVTVAPGATVSGGPNRMPEIVMVGPVAAAAVEPADVAEDAGSVEVVVLPDEQAVTKSSRAKTRAVSRVIRATRSDTRAGSVRPRGFGLPLGLA